MSKSAKFVNPLNGTTIKLPTGMTLDQIKAIAVSITCNPAKRPADRLAWARFYLALTGQMPTEVVEGAPIHILRVVVDGHPTATSSVSTSVSTTTSTPVK